MNQPLDLDQIDTVIAAATPGPWTADSSIPYGHRVGSSDEADWVAWTGEHGETGSEADAKYIAAMNPDTARAMAAEIRRLRAQAAMVCAVCETPVGWIDCPTGGWWAHDAHPADGHDASPKPAAVEAHVVADDSNDPEHVDDCPGCEAFTLTGHRAARP